MSISFRFDNLEYQRQAVNSVISLLEGQSQDANKNTQEFTKKDTNQLQDYGVPVHSNPSLTISKEILAKKPAKIILLDSGFGEDDELKINCFQKIQILEQQKEQSIILKTI